MQHQGRNLFGPPRGFSPDLAHVLRRLVMAPVVIVLFMVQDPLGFFLFLDGLGPGHGPRRPDDQDHRRDEYIFHGSLSLFLIWITDNSPEPRNSVNSPRIPRP